MSSDITSAAATNIFIIKGRIKSISTNLYGQFILIFNNKKHIDQYNVVISTFSDLYELVEPHDDWINYQEKIADMKWQGKFNVSMTNSLMELIKSFASTDEINAFYEQIYNYDYDNLELTLYDLINRIIHDKNLTIETGIQEVTLEDFKRNREDDDKQTEDEGAQQDDELDDGTIILNTKPILAPVKGKPIYELRTGDMIMIKILARTDRDNYYIDLLELRDEENNIMPTPATVIDIKSGMAKKDPVEILVEITDDIFGKIFEEETQVKLRVYNPGLDGPLAKKPTKEKNKVEDKKAPEKLNASSTKGLLIMTFLFFIIVILLAVVIFMFL